MHSLSPAIPHPSGKAKWEIRQLDAKPPLRVGAGMVYSYGLSRIVLFGGHRNMVAKDDTWLWDGSMWQMVTSTPIQPAPRWSPAISYDPLRQQVIMFGGEDNGKFLSDIWVFDSQGWNEIEPQDGPSARSGSAMAFDSLSQACVMFGGYDGAAHLDETWSWNGKNWSRLPQSTVSYPARRTAMALCQNTFRKGLLLSGGHGDGSLVLEDTWTWDGSQWREEEPGPRRFSHAMAESSLPDEIVLFGGNNGEDTLGETWIWNGHVWTERKDLALHPHDGDRLSMAYDSVRSEVVEFGGEGSEGTNNETWIWK